MAEIPESHPRRKSLISRKTIVEATKKGLLADSAMIAHGRGEAFDYLLGEKTSLSALRAIKEVANRLKKAKRPVISVNGNTAILNPISCNSFISNNGVSPSSIKLTI